MSSKSNADHRVESRYTAASLVGTAPAIVEAEEGVLWRPHFTSNRRTAGLAWAQRLDRPGSAAAAGFPPHYLQPDSRRPSRDHPHDRRITARLVESLNELGAVPVSPRPSVVVRGSASPATEIDSVCRGNNDHCLTPFRVPRLRLTLSCLFVRPAARDDHERGCAVQRHARVSRDLEQRLKAGDTDATSVIVAGIPGADCAHCGASWPAD